MCPDEELLSSFLDDEVPSPWKERIEKHLLTCSACTTRLDRYRLLRLSLANIESAEELNGISEAKIRIAESLTGKRHERGHYELSLLEWIQRILTTRVALPLPFLAAGIAVVVFIAGILFGAVRILPGSSRTIATSTRTIDTAQFGAEALASYMRQAQIQPVTIEMPGDAILGSYGNPVFVASEPMMIQVSTTLARSK